MLDYDYLSPDQVTSPETLAQYIQQRTGTPWPTLKDMIVMKKRCKEFFEHYPHANYFTLCRVADWAQCNNRRFATVHAVIEPGFRYAYQAGALSELDMRGHADPKVEHDIAEALKVETDSVWRTRLACTQDASVRKEVIATWHANRSPMLAV